LSDAASTGITRGACRNATTVGTADAHDGSPAQVLIRWHVQLGNIVIPKSVNPETVVTDFDRFEFEISEQEHDRVPIHAR
jgi:2,5-diketo-D-gluconate reductase A